LPPCWRCLFSNFPFQLDCLAERDPSRRVPNPKIRLKQGKGVFEHLLLSRDHFGATLLSGRYVLAHSTMVVEVNCSLGNKRIPPLRRNPCVVNGNFGPSRQRLWWSWSREAKWLSARFELPPRSSVLQSASKELRARRWSCIDSGQSPAFHSGTEIASRLMA
jgi:hypothetical protein